MKHDVDDLDETYGKCIATGNIREKSSVDMEMIKSLRLLAEKSLEFIKWKSKDIKKDSTDWTFVFRDYYDALRALIDAYLLFDKVGADSHQCNNACLCMKHPELGMDWEFMETARLRRNYLNYRGLMLTYDDWERFKINFELHIQKLMKEIDKKIK